MNEKSPEIDHEDSAKETLSDKISETNKIHPRISFSYDGSIDEIDLDSKVTNQHDNTTMTLNDAFNRALKTWEVKNTASTMIDVTCNDYEGQMLLLDNGDLVRSINQLEVKPKKDFQRQINFNRFAFDNSIVNLELDSSLKYLVDDFEISLTEVFEKGQSNWSMGYAPL